MAVADLNADGWQDAAVQTAFNFDADNDFKINLFYQTPQHNLVLTRKLNGPAVYGNRRSICAGRLDGDAYPELVLSFGADSLAVFFQKPGGGFEDYMTLQTGNTPDMVAIGDLNNDSLNDIAVANWNDLFVSVFYNNGQRTFARRDYPCPQGGWTDMEIADINGDQRQDLLLMQGQGAAGVYLYPQQPDGLLGAPVVIDYSQSIFDLPTAMATGDLNQDGRNDLITTRSGNRPNAAIRIYLQQSSGSLTLSQTLPAYDIPESVQVVDLNCDQINEIVVAHGGWNQVSVYQQSSPGVFDTFTLFPTPYASHYTPQSLDCGDFSGDGVLDVGLASWDHGWILLTNRSPGSAGNPIVTETFLQAVLIGTVEDTLDGAYTYTDVQRDTVQSVVYVRTNTLLVNTQQIIRHITVDSVFSVLSRTCLSTASDTVVRQAVFQEEGPLQVDTSLIGTQVDTILLTDTRQPVSALPWRFTVFPNPFQSALWVQFSSTAGDISGLKISVYTTEGKRLDLDGGGFLWLSDHLMQIDLGLLPAGAYLLQLENAQWKAIHPVFKGQ